MIVFDGDSVVLQGGYAITPQKCWPHLVANGREYKNAGVHMSTAKDCHARLPQVFELNPKWYVLQIGQWSQNHEDVSTFEHYMRQICEEMNLRSVRVVLVTPGVQILDGFNVIPFVTALEKLSRIYKTGFVNVHQWILKSGANLPDLVCDDHSKCHFNETGSELVAQCFNRSVWFDS